MDVCARNKFAIEMKAVAGSVAWENFPKKVAVKIKQMAKVVLLAYFFALSVSVAQAGAITIGTQSPGNSGENCIPFGCPAQFSLDRYQQVYSADAFSGPVDIFAFTFFNTINFGGNESNAITPASYVFSLSTTTMPVGGLDTVNLDNNIGSDSQIFFSGVLGGPLLGTEFTVVGTTMPFQYDPAYGNLLLDIAISSLGPDTFTFFDFQQNSDLFSRTFNGQPSGELQSGLVTRFSVPEPGTLGLLGIGLALLLHRRRRCGSACPRPFALAKFPR